MWELRSRTLGGFPVCPDLNSVSWVCSQSASPTLLQASILTWSCIWPYKPLYIGKCYIQGQFFTFRANEKYKTAKMLFLEQIFYFQNKLRQNCPLHSSYTIKSKKKNQNKDHFVFSCFYCSGNENFAPEITFYLVHFMNWY